ncbi:putative 1-acylglycerol-3-phosphate O-acyltransferase [Rosa chinensis]|uniref:Putative 1-acylglycerol-3-phosphate O-acyltransferase n=1 Tax=Rosa chinensis TaxID=74649 RepID=A0A2P6RZM3_ROSCH|nr:putative 1-acylglycerol-3-phosphate O-acyltransferase [Rosa chinensis]
MTKGLPSALLVNCFYKRNLFHQGELIDAQMLPFPGNVSCPLSKDFVCAVRHALSFVPAIYDMPVGIPKTSLPPTLGRLFKEEHSVVSLTYFGEYFI